MKICLLEDPEREFRDIEKNPCSEKIELSKLNEIIEGGIELEEKAVFLYKGCKFVYIGEKIYGVSGRISEKRIIEEDMKEEIRLALGQSNITSCSWEPETTKEKMFDEGIEIIIPWNQTVILKDCFSVSYNKKISVTGKIEEASFLMAPVNFKIYGQTFGIKENYLSLDDVRYILDELLMFLYRERLDDDKIRVAASNVEDVEKMEL